MEHDIDRAPHTSARQRDRHMFLGHRTLDSEHRESKLRVMKSLRKKVQETEESRRTDGLLKTEKAALLVNRKLAQEEVEQCVSEIMAAGPKQWVQTFKRKI
ncbi:hypothetical protein AAFF_G00233790 [Aldrovandia affinis]|uniref:Uncharacterized protein n=1 Tax=Aldrovandia affinis TaxID=143900 RepID=A0AAD7W4T7_9TELE|nr:hypothetical protein AAFF_G00233790 [Aldrovandia affinis]